jgi:hypothetical protein
VVKSGARYGIQQQICLLKLAIILSNACGRSYSEGLTCNGVAARSDDDDVNTTARRAGGAYDPSSVSPAARSCQPHIRAGGRRKDAFLVMSLPVKKPSNYLGALSCLPTYADGSAPRHRSA